MDQINAQKQLNELYNDYFIKRYNEISKEIDDEILKSLSIPYLLHVPKNYFKGKRVWYVGQEPYLWYGLYDKKRLEPEGIVDYAVQSHHEFFNGGMVNSPIWNFLGKLKEDAQNSIVCNNIYKFSYIEAGLSPNSKLFKSKENQEKYLKPIYQLQQDILLKELEILKPEVILFMTGHDNDPLYFDNIGDKGIAYQSKQYQVQYDDIDEAAKIGIDKWKFGQLIYDKFPEETYRTYHPGYLRRSRHLSNEQKEFIISFLQSKVKG